MTHTKPDQRQKLVRLGEDAGGHPIFNGALVKVRDRKVRGIVVSGFKGDALRAGEDKVGPYLVIRVDGAERLARFDTCEVQRRKA